MTSRIRRGTVAQVVFAAMLGAAVAGCGGGGDDDGGASAAQAQAPASTATQDAGVASAATTAAPGATRPEDAAAGPGASPATPATATTGGDGSDIVLSPLTGADIEGAPLAGELACSFAVGGDAPLLLAKGNVDSQEASRGVVKVGDYVEPVGAPGGFDAMLDGGTFAGQGKTVIVAITGPATGGGESPAKPATLTYQRADGAERTWNGAWTCGP